ncbi:STAS domain-containing protein [Nocardia otitidiscaviarum]|uniref:STAS domain-containing protein n=2 Tax=Nocardia otitidiscaviarum TaxID=1823 RepID=A0A516NJX2_9NOCA|nr:STAS domain-containing protein [Nocardia otitidiscaviarum]
MSAIALLQRGVDADTPTNGSRGDRSDRLLPSMDSHQRTCTIVRVEGELDAAIFPEFSEALERAVTSSSRAVIVDFRQTRFLSIGSALKLAGAKEAAVAGGVDLRVVAARREVERVLDVTGVRPLFHVYPSVQAALEA